MLEGQTNMAFTLRPARPDDEAFLYKLYADTRADELAQYGWDDAQKEMFLNLQFKGQQQHYKMAGPGCEHQIILVEGRPAGRLMVIRTDKEIRLADISLLAEHRNNRVGSRLIRDLQVEAAKAEKPLTLHVEFFNHGAIRLYERLGFRSVANTGTHFRMEWNQ